LFGEDGAIIKKPPLLNIFASGVHLKACGLLIAKCTKNLQDATSKKDAAFNTSNFEEYLYLFEK
jgi:hypothetical protein